MNEAASTPIKEYSDIVVDSFLTNAVRTAILIDDSFPSFPELCDEESEATKLYKGSSRAKSLYKMFHLRHILCDIENAPDSDNVERLRKSDLIILDYHLNPGDQDPTKALEILKKLSLSPHFNIVAIYTYEELNKVFTEVFEALGNPSTHSGSNYVEPIWIQKGNVFIAILKKFETEIESLPDDPELLWQRIGNALKDWNPNLVQVLLSEIQNKLEVEGVTVDDTYSGSAQRQLGILYIFFRALQEAGETAEKETLRPFVEQLVGRIMETVQREIGTDKNLLDYAWIAAEGERQKTAWKGIPTDLDKHVKPLLAFITNSTARDEVIKPEDIICELNTFLCSDKFRGSYLTTGTVFQNTENANEWWMCCSPACDMVLGQEGKGWQEEISPSKPFHAIRLKIIEKSEKELANAHKGRRIFVKTEANDLIQLEVLNQANNPDWEIMILREPKQVSTGSFDTLRIRKKTVPKSEITEVEGGNKSSEPKVEHEMQAFNFKAVAQLRPEYAARILHFTGFHLSRIGVDFRSLPK